jgi:hypothetical protein
VTNASAEAAPLLSSAVLTGAKSPILLGHAFIIVILLGGLILEAIASAFPINPARAVLKLVSGTLTSASVLIALFASLIQGRRACGSSITSVGVAGVIGSLLAIAHFASMTASVYADSPCNWCTAVFFAQPRPILYVVYGSFFVIMTSFLWSKQASAVLAGFAAVCNLLVAVFSALANERVDLGLCGLQAVSLIYYLGAAFLLIRVTRVDALVRLAFAEQEHLAAQEEQVEETSRRAASDAAATSINGLVKSGKLKMVEPDELEMGELIGSGGFGEVYNAQYRGSRVAVKRLLASARGDAFTEFLKEVGVLARLKHPNIVRLVGVSFGGAEQLLILELCSRGSLYDILKKASPADMPFRLIHSIGLDAARAMHYLHTTFDRPILHRDLKSQNVLLTESLSAKVCDFGFSRMSVTKTMSRIGTVQWVAPEVLRGERYTFKADVWSYGVVLWELVSRESPYRGQASLRVASNVAFGAWRLRCPSYTPHDLAELTRACWRDPQLRPTFQEIVDHLEASDPSKWELESSELRARRQKQREKKKKRPVPQTILPDQEQGTDKPVDTVEGGGGEGSIN